MKNVIIGIDGGSVNHILPQVKRGKLNNFQKIFDDGFVSNLSVTEPPVTIPSFPCIFSGMDVKDLGKCELYNLDYGVFSSKYWREKSIFSLEEIKTFCLNIPATYPAWKINGEMVTGFLSPAINENMVYPKSLLAEIKNKWIIDGKNVDEIFRAFEIKKKFFLKKLKEDFDLLIFIIRMPDLITHHPEFLLKNTSKNIKKAYRKIDEFLGILLDNPNIDNLIVLSDHGLKKYPKQFSIKKYLESEKILNYNQTDIIFKLLSFLFKLLIYLNPKFLDIKYFHNKIKDIFKDRIKLKPIKNHIDSRFVQFYSNYGGIFLGAKDKKKKQKLMNNLKTCKYVKKCVEFNSKYLPDILIVLDDDYLYTVRGSLFIKTQFNSYNHFDKGIFMACGKNIKKSRSKEISYLDIVPSLLKLYGISNSKKFKGKPIDMFNNT